MPPPKEGVEGLSEAGGAPAGRISPAPKRPTKSDGDGAKVCGPDPELGWALRRKVVRVDVFRGIFSVGPLMHNFWSVLSLLLLSFQNIMHYFSLTL